MIGSPPRPRQSRTLKTINFRDKGRCRGRKCVLCNGDTSLRQEANDLFDALNQGGAIS
jgi:hypothetical protein